MKNNKKLPSIVALSICLELVVSPIPALAGPNTMKSISDAMNLGMQAYGTFQGQGQQQMPAHVATDMANFQKQQTPAPDKQFTLQNMQKIPGLMEYIAKKNQDAAKNGGKPINPNSLNCTTLPTTLFKSDTEVCRSREVNPLAGDPKMQADEAFAYYNQYTQIENVYQNYSASSNVGGQSFGLGCMEDAMTILKGFFAYRVEQLDTVVAEIEAATANFEKQSEMDLKSIRESTAILTGENSKFATEFKNTDIFDYGKRFEDPACNSLLSKDDMDKFGKEGGGLLAIEKKLKADLGTTPAGSKYSAESYIKNHADVERDIKSMADKVAEQATLNFSQLSSGQEGYSAFLSGLSGDVTSESGAHQGLNKSMFADLQTKFAKERNALKDEESLVMSELGGNASAAGRLLSKIDNDSTFEAEVTSLENRIKGECLQKSIGDSFSRIHNLNLSKQADQKSSEPIKKKLDSILNDVTTSPEFKMAELKALGDGRYEMIMDSDVDTKEVLADGTIVEKKIKAAGKVSPSSYFTSVIKHCETQFRGNKLGNKLTGREAIKRLRSLKKDYQKASREHAKDIKKEIVKKMIDCNGNGAVASSSTVASCTPEKLNMANPGFCAKAAFSCSTNMKKCTEKAQKFVTDIKGDRLKRTNNYNNNVEANRKQLVGMFDAALTKYVKEAESLRGMFGTGFSAPKGIKRDINDGTQFDQKFANNAPDALEIKDPKKYLEMVKDNMVSLQEQVKAQQDGIIGSDGALQKHIDQTKKNYKEQVLAKAGQLAKDCLAAYNNYKAMVKGQADEYNKKMGESNEAKNKFCRKYSMAMQSNSPNPACGGEISDLADAALSSVNTDESNQAAADLIEVCNSSNNEKDPEHKDPTQICKGVTQDTTLAINCKYLGIAKECRDLKTTGEEKDKKQKQCLAMDSNLDATKDNFWATASKNADIEITRLIKIIEDDGNKSSPKNSATDSQIAAQKRMKEGGMPAFCSANNNSGPYNTKTNSPQNPLLGERPSGAGGFNQ